MLLIALWILMPRVLRGILNLLGFKSGGVERDSYAARYQSYNYGSFVPEDSWFAASQSRAAIAEEDTSGYNPNVTARGVVLLVVSIAILLTAAN
ncbi:hypothetical protein EXIGLDRAFT_767519 [Exidia glandulosa HHB12029]|uniref:Uncharacterized protein n=1 Tax=Exidia glandulosa HHB12029 TaxID=1314781 RepID=A0A165IWG9_EXIGL|nr:hypothetical protein EXIGLDRAFT_767519 [Exidia glandulosa HHB12029]